MPALEARITSRKKRGKSSEAAPAHSAEFNRKCRRVRRKSGPGLLHTVIVRTEELWLMNFPFFCPVSEL